MNRIKAILLALVGVNVVTAGFLPGSPSDGAAHAADDVPTYTLVFDGSVPELAKKGCLAQVAQQFGLSHRRGNPAASLDEIVGQANVPWDLPVEFSPRADPAEAADKAVERLNRACAGAGVISLDVPVSLAVDLPRRLNMGGAARQLQQGNGNGNQGNGQGNGGEAMDPFGKPVKSPKPPSSPPPPPSPTPTPTPSPSPTTPPSPLPSPSPVPSYSQPVAAGETTPNGIKRIGAVYYDANNVLTSVGGSDVTVAVIDTGIQVNHPDLNVANDGVSYIGVDCTGSGTFVDGHGHGTHVSGTIAAKNNGFGVIGVAPGTRLIAVRVLDSSGSGTSGTVACGLNWVAQNAAKYNIKVASMSLGGGGTNGACNSDSQHQAVCNAVAAGVTVVVAAGNSAVDFTNAYPAAFAEVLTVTSVSDRDGLPYGAGNAKSYCLSDSDDSPSYFSNYALNNTASQTVHTIAGPGGCVYSTYLNSGYATMSGTSMATPHVSGAVALCHQRGTCAGLTPAQIVQSMRDQARNHAVGSMPSATNGFLSDGFKNDPLNPPSVDNNKYYGYLAWAQ